MRNLGWVSIAIAAIIATACAGQNANPAAPTPPAPGATELVVTRASGSDSAFQLTATATTPDGSAQDVTGAATWASSNPGVAAVSSSGYVTVVGTGDVELQASYAGASGSYHLIANVPPAFTVSGTVSAAAPDAHPVKGARVQIVGGPHTFTDAGGRFSFSGVRAGPLIFEVTSDGYDLYSRIITVNRDVDLQIELTPAAD